MTLPKPVRRDKPATSERRDVPATAQCDIRPAPAQSDIPPASVRRVVSAAADLGGWLKTVEERLELAFEPEQRARILQYIALLRDWNRRINLVARDDDQTLAERHLLDSLTLLPILDRVAAGVSGRTPRLTDVGSGAGLPGIPLKIARPLWQVSLLDALAKRVVFLNDVIDSLSLGNTAALHMRAEDAGRQAAFREQSDLVVARAVSSLPVLCEYCLPLTRVGGYFVAMKGPAEGEWPHAGRAAAVLGGTLDECLEFCLPGTEMRRVLYLFRKTKKTPEAYPRPAGKPQKAPL